MKYYWKIFVFASILKSVDVADLRIPLDHGTCENWIKTTETHLAGDCTRNGPVIHCFGGMSNLHVIHPLKLKKIEEVVLCGWPNRTFDPQDVLKNFPKIHLLRIEHSNLTQITNDFPEIFALEHINISWTKLSFTRPTLFKKLYALKVLDLRWNELDHMDQPLILPESFEELYLAGNPWNCTRNLKWLLTQHKGDHVVDRDLLQCFDTKYQNKHLMTVMHFKLKLHLACQTHPDLSNCSCSMHYIRKSDDGKSLTPIYTVNCSNLHLTHLPSYIPENTTIFYGIHNKISDVQPLRDNIFYRDVLDVYLDFNSIDDIDILESSYWLRHFRVLSLRANNLLRLPVYALDNALEKNHHAAKLYLSQNPWICECKFTMRFQEILRKYYSIIKDSSNIMCKFPMDNDNDANKTHEKQKIVQVLSLDRNDLCKLPNVSKIHALDLVNGVLAFLIVFVIVNFFYDYYHYRRSGRLPWIVTKMP